MTGSRIKQLGSSHEVSSVSCVNISVLQYRARLSNLHNSSILVKATNKSNRVCVNNSAKIIRQKTCKHLQR